jgi:FLVCR family MFS transporter 7
VFLLFGVLASASVSCMCRIRYNLPLYLRTNVFAVLTAEILQPVGYSSDTAGFMGAVLLLSGIVAAIVTAPIFDRVFTTHLAITAKILVPVLSVAWLSLIWAGRT